MNAEERVPLIATVLGGVTMIAVAVVIGILDHSWAVGILLLASPYLAILGMNAILRGGHAGWLAVAASIAALGFATWLSGMEGRWLWAVPWGMAALGFTVVGIAGRAEDGGPSQALFALAALCGVFAVVGPWFVYGSFGNEAAVAAVSQSAPIVSAFDPSSVPGAMVAFARTAFGSVWGWLNLALLVIVGRTWGKRLGVPAAVLGTMALVAVLAATTDGGAHTLATGFASSPAGVMRVVIRASERATGTAGWGILAAGAVVAALLARATRGSVRVNAVLSRAGVRSPFSPSPQGLIERAVDDVPGFMLSGIAVLALGGFAPLAMWLALRGASVLPFAAIGMPDLAVPQLRPVWHPSYFAAAGVVAATAFAGMLLIRRRGAAVSVPVFGHPLWMLVWPFLLALFAPGGVVVFAAAFGVVTVVALALPLGETGIRAGTPSSELEQAGLDNFARLAQSSGPGATPGAPPPTQPLTGGYRIVPDDEATPGPQTMGEPEPVQVPVSAENVLDAGTELVGAAETADWAVVTLAPDGALTWWRDATRDAGHAVKVVRPLGVVPCTGASVVLVDGGGRMLALEPGAGGASVAHSCATGGPFDLYAAPPDGRFVAFADSSVPGIKVFEVAEDSVRDLGAAAGAPCALAVSLDGGLVACGLADGSVTLLDAASGSTAGVLRSSDAAPGSSHIAAMRDGGWVVASADKRVAVYTGAGELLGDFGLSGTATCLAACPGTGQVAVGSARGFLRVRSADLKSFDFDGRVANGPLVTVWFSRRHVVAASKSGEVRAVLV